ncbi:MAG: CRISPR-associated endonuclease Cas1 [Sulfolobales archaeon]
MSGYGVKLKVKNNYIVIHSKDSVKEVAPSEVDSIIIATSGVVLTSKFLRLVSNYGIDLVVVDSRGYPVSRFYHPYITRTADSRIAQYMSYSNGLCREVAKSIAYCKLMNQSTYLVRLSRLLRSQELREAGYSIESLANKALSLSVDDFHELRKELMSIEAHGARTYWSSVAYVLPSDLKFEGRDQDGEDQVNMVLNYGYGIVYPECWKALVLAGLDPYAGFLHVERSGKPVLVYDLIEMFRVAAVDSVLISKFRDGWRAELSDGLLTPKSRGEVIKSIIENLNRRFKCKHSESYMTLVQWIRHTALELADALRSGKRPRGFIVRW